MYFNIKKFIKDGKLKNPNKIKKKIKKSLLDPEHGELQFIETFTEIAELKNWKWLNEDITKESVVEHMVSFAYRIIAAELEYYLKHNKYSKHFAIAAIGTGRIIARPVDFEDNGYQTWLDIEFSTTL